MKMNWAAKRWVKIMLHILFWVVIFSLPSLLRPSNENHQGPPPSAGATYQYILSCATYIGLFYFNAYYLIPTYFTRQKYSQYALALTLVLLFLAFINWLSFTLLVPQRQFRFGGFVFFYFFPCIFFLVCSTAFRMEDQLPGSMFIRIQKSYIVSKESITAIRKNSVFIGTMEVPIGENYKDVVNKLIGRPAD